MSSKKDDEEYLSTARYIADLVGRGFEPGQFDYDEFVRLTIQDMRDNERLRLAKVGADR